MSDKNLDKALDTILNMPVNPVVRKKTTYEEALSTLENICDVMLEGCDYPEEVQDTVLDAVQTWVNSFTELCFCQRPLRHCNCP